jgi:integrase/recombinase XerC
MGKVVSPRNSKRLPYYIEQEGMKNLFSEGRFEENFIGYRNKAILETFYGTGMRLNELRTLTLEHLDLDQNTLKVIGKRNKERIIPFGDTMKKAILEYLSIKEESFDNPKQNDFLFVSQSGNELDPKTIYIIVRKYTDQVTTIGKRSPHILRHTFATHLLNEEAPLNAIKEMLGHSSLASTQIYSHNSISRLKNIYKQAHPRA